MKALVAKWNNANIKSKVIYKNLLVSYGIKVLSMLVSFLQIRVTLNFLSTSDYGLWVTIVSFTSWISILDFGLGNGMRNKLTEAVSANDVVTAKSYLSTGYLTISAIFLGLVIIISPVVLLADWHTIMNTALTDAYKIKVSVLAVFISVCLQFILRLISSVYFAHQKASSGDVITFVSQVAIFICLIVSRYVITGSLISFALIYSIIPLIIYGAINIYAFTHKFKAISPSIRFFTKTYIKSITTTGGNFFIIQLSALILYSTDNFLINYFLGADSVMIYSIPFRYFSFVLISFQLIFPPYWSMIIKAAQEKDIQWIKNTKKNLVYLWLLFFAASIIMVIVSKTFYRVWLGKTLDIPLSLTICFMVYVSLANWAAIFNTITFALGKTTVQFYACLASIILNVPITILLLKKTALNLLAPPVVMIVYTLITCILVPYYLKNILHKMATA